MSRIILIVTILLSFTGCFSQILSVDEYTRLWIGHPIEEKMKSTDHPNSYASSIGWKRTTYSLDNGNKVYIEPEKPRTFIHWEVNPQGIIIGAKHEIVGRGETTKGRAFWYQ
ncbi:MAG: hypothetical protein AAGU11_18835 [Syntrophobacteraceae bacterium]